MNYEDFIYEFIKLLKEWGVWTWGISIVCGDKEYSPCKSPKFIWDESWESYRERQKAYEKEKRNSKLRDLKDVNISEITPKNKDFQTRWDENCVMFVSGNSQFNDLFDFGVLETNLSDVSLAKREEVYQNNEELQQEFHMDYDIEDIDEIEPCPDDAFGLPSILEFDSADEYKAFIENEIDSKEKDFIQHLHGRVIYDNELEVLIGELLDKYDLSYDFVGDGMYIGHDFY